MNQLADRVREFLLASPTMTRHEATVLAHALAVSRRGFTPSDATPPRTVYMTPRRRAPGFGLPRGER